MTKFRVQVVLEAAGPPESPMELNPFRRSWGPGHVYSLRGPTQEDRRKFVASIDRQSHNMSALVDDLLTSSSIESGGRHTSPDLIVRVDPHHLGRIVDNRVQNAFKYGKPPVRVDATRVGDMVEVRVLDHGPGPGPAARRSDRRSWPGTSREPRRGIARPSWCPTPGRRPHRR